jgi:hypothetical protein
MRAPVTEEGPQIRLLRSTVEEMKADLRRPHAHAFERVGFLAVNSSRGAGGEWILYGTEYFPVDDGHYVEDETCGARIGGEAIRAALRQVLRSGQGLLHVHLHDHPGLPNFSRTDLREQPALVESFSNLVRERPHGMLVLSDDRANALVRLPDGPALREPRQITIVGDPLVRVQPAHEATRREPVSRAEQFARQSFLGEVSEHQLDTARVAVVGMGGGGSHAVQQFAHLGVRNLRVFDADRVETTNLNRLVGATLADAFARTPKVAVANRVAVAILGPEGLEVHECRWEDAVEVLRSADVVVGCVDSFAGRRDLEAAARRNMVPYVDIGMDVHRVEGEAPQVGGQVILSMPDAPCMHCVRFLTPEKLAREAANYGDAGGKPQVVWPNGVLASTAVGIVVDLLTGWSGVRDRPPMLMYDANRNLLVPHPRLSILRLGGCTHYPAHQTGDPVFRPLSPPT